MDQWKVDKSRHLFGDMVYTPKGETNAMFIFWPHSCFYTFFYLSIWNPLINSYFYEYCKPFSACLWSLLKAKWTYFQHVLISSKSENNSVLKLSENISCGFFLSICFVANSGESALACFLREISCGVVFFTDVILLWGNRQLVQASKSLRSVLKSLAKRNMLKSVNRSNLKVLDYRKLLFSLWSLWRLWERMPSWHLIR